MPARSQHSHPALAWALAGVALLAVNTLAHASAGYSPWWHALGAGVGNTLRMALVAIVAWRTAARPWLRIGGSARAWLLLSHVVAGTAGATLATALSLGARLLPHAHAAHHLGPGPAAGFLFWWFVFLYGAVGAVRHALDAREMLRARELEVTRAELRALRAQLDPHFLFNALHSLGVLVRTDPARAEEAVVRLGDLLRYVLRAGRRESAPDRRGGGSPLDDEVPLDEELSFVRDYLEVERIRFGERLRVREEIDAGTCCALVPPLILQPLVENAVKYAVATRRRGATIRLVARRASDVVLGAVLHLGVLDDGGRASPSLDGTRTPPHGMAIPGERLGLDGLRRRLAACYGDAGRMVVATSDGEGFGVWLVLPWREGSTARAFVDDARAAMPAVGRSHG